MNRAAVMRHRWRARRTAPLTPRCRIKRRFPTAARLPMVMNITKAAAG
jgi:hypothetical protein